MKKIIKNILSVPVGISIVTILFSLTGVGTALVSFITYNLIEVFKATSFTMKLLTYGTVMPLVVSIFALLIYGIISLCYFINYILKKYQLNTKTLSLTMSVFAVTSLLFEFYDTLFIRDIDYLDKGMFLFTFGFVTYLIIFMGKEGEDDTLENII